MSPSGSNQYIHRGSPVAPLDAATRSGVSAAVTADVDPERAAFAFVEGSKAWDAKGFGWDDYREWAPDGGGVDDAEAWRSFSVPEGEVRADAEVAAANGAMSKVYSLVIDIGGDVVPYASTDKDALLVQFTTAAEENWDVGDLGQPPGMAKLRAVRYFEEDAMAFLKAFAAPNELIGSTSAQIVTVSGDGWTNVEFVDSEATAMSVVADHAREWWDQECPDTDQPDNDDDLVDEYFDGCDETFATRQVSWVEPESG